LTCDFKWSRNHVKSRRLHCLHDWPSGLVVEERQNDRTGGVRNMENRMSRDRGQDSKFTMRIQGSSMTRCIEVILEAV
jgi:hypothetical protein